MPELAQLGGTASATEPMAEAIQRAQLVVAYSEIVGLIEPETEAGVSVDRFNSAVRSLAAIGVARHVRPLPIPAPFGEFSKATQLVFAAIENSPMPQIEWPAMHGLLDHLLPDLVGVSVSSVSRYRSGDRETPDAVAARLHVLALIVRDLAGSYNDFGIRRWFQRSRTALGGKPPSAVLSESWDPDGEGPREVRELAARLIGPGAG